MCFSSRSTSCACSVEEARGAAAKAVAAVEVGSGGMGNSGMGAPVDMAAFEVGAGPSAPGRAAHMASCCMRPFPKQSLPQCRQGVLSKGTRSVRNLASNTGRCSTCAYTQRKDQDQDRLRKASTFHMLPSALRTQ